MVGPDLVITVGPESVVIPNTLPVASTDAQCLTGGSAWIAYRSNCLKAPASIEYINAHMRTLLVEKAPSASPPAWIEIGAAMYIDLMYRSVRTSTLPDGELTSHVRSVLEQPIRLERLAGIGAWMSPINRHSNHGAAILAVNLLLEHAGEPALFEYIHLLPAESPGDSTAGSWQTAFSEAFGVTIADFYAAFELYRQRVRADWVFLLGDYAVDPSTAEGPALIDDHRIGSATRSVAR